MCANTQYKALLLYNRIIILQEYAIVLTILIFIVFYRQVQQQHEGAEMDMNPKTQGTVHPEQRPTEYFLGYFQPDFAEKLNFWSTKRIGSIALQKNGKPYPSTIQERFRPVPVFVARMEAIENQEKLLYGSK